MSAMISERLDGTPDKVRLARRIVAAALGEAHPCLDDAVLLVSETATNAVRYSRSARSGGSFTLVVEHTPEWVRVTVRDDGADRVPCLCLARQGPENTTTGGRGMALLDAIAARWGLLREPAAAALWFEVGARRM